MSCFNGFSPASSCLLLLPPTPASYPVTQHYASTGEGSTPVNSSRTFRFRRVRRFKLLPSVGRHPNTDANGHRLQKPSGCSGAHISKDRWDTQFLRRFVRRLPQTIHLYCFSHGDIFVLVGCGQRSIGRRSLIDHQIISGCNCRHHWFNHWQPGGIVSRKNGQRQ